MALTVPQQWTGTGGRDDVQIGIQPTAGSWVLATVSYRAVDGSSPLASVADLARNWWVLLGSASNATSGTRVEVWACPAVDYAAFPLDIVYAAISHIHADDVGSVCVNVCEVSGFGNNFPTLVSATPGTATGLSLGITMPAPGKNVMVVAAAATDNNAVTVTAPNSPWTALTAVSRNTPDLGLKPVWQAASTGQTATWTAPSSLVWTGVVVAIAETGDVWPQPNPAWPATRLSLGPTVGQETPLPRVAWTDVTNRFEALVGATRGIQYELGRPQAGTASLALRNFDDLITPSAAGTYDLYTPYQLLMAWGGKVYPVSSGYVEQWQRRWTTPHHGYLDGSCVDAVATLVQTVPTPTRGEILRHNPSHYWPLADPQGSTNAINISGRSTTMLYLARSKYGPSNATADFGAQTGIDGDPGTGWQQQGLVAGDTTKGYALVAEDYDGGFPPISGGVTIFGFSYMPPTVVLPSSGSVLVILRSKDARNGTVIKFWVEASLVEPRVTVWDKDTGASTTTAGSYGMAQSRVLPWVLRFNRTAWKARHTSGVTEFSGSCDLPDQFVEISIGGEADRYYNGNSLAGTLAHIAVFDRWLTDGEVDQLMLDAAKGWRGSEAAHQRAQRFMAISQANTPRALDYSSTWGAADATTGTLAERAADVADQDTGLLFGDGAGYLRFRSNSRTCRQSVRWVLGDDTASGEIPFQVDAMPGVGPTYLFNRVAVANSGERVLSGSGQTFVQTYPDVVHSAVDVDSGQRYGWRPMDRTTHLYSTASAYGLAHWLLNQYSTPRYRFESVTVDAASYPAAWPLVLGVEVGDLVDVVRRPVGQAAVRVSCRVMSLRHDIAYGRGQTRGKVTLTLAVAFPPVILVGSATLGRLGSGTIGWA